MEKATPRGEPLELCSLATHHISYTLQGLFDDPQEKPKFNLSHRDIKVREAYPLFFT